MPAIKQHKANLERAARFLIEQTCGAKPRFINRLPLGVSNYNYAVKCEYGPSYVVRYYPRTREHLINFEPDLLRRCTEAGVPVPEVITDSRTGPASELHYTIYKMIPGAPLSQRYTSLSQTCQRDITGQLAKVLQKLRCIKFDGFGELIDGKRARHIAWRTFVHESLTEGLKSAKQYYLLPGAMLASLQKVVNVYDTWLGNVFPELVWADISLDNIILDDQNNLAGIIDFEGALSGDYLLSLGYCHAKYNTNGFFSTLSKAWPEPLGDKQWSQINLYTVLRVLRVAPYAHEALPTGHPRAHLLSIFPGLSLALVRLQAHLPE